MTGAEPLVGREHVRGLLTDALARTRGGAGRTILLSGEPGIGKSAVLTWLADEARDAVVCRGFCWDGTGAPPYWPWTQVVRAGGFDRDSLGEAAWLVDGTGAPPVGSAAAAADAQFRVCDAVSQLIVRAADTSRPVVVVLDDLQWADEPSLSLLSFLGRAAVGSPVLVVGAYRDAEAPPALTEIAGHVQHLPIGPLTVSEVEQVVALAAGLDPEPAVVRRIWERAGGNPFFTRELAHLVQAYGTADAAGYLPTSVVEAVRRRLARLPTDCARLLDWAAVASRDIDVPLLVAAGAADDETAGHAVLDPARRAGVVSDVDGLRFTHDIYREAIVAAQPAALNAAINRALGRALVEVGGGAARVAGHLLRAGPDARADAVEFSLRAGHEATARLGHDDASAHYERALELLDADDPRAVSVLLDLAAAVGRAGRGDSAMQRYREAADLAARRGDSSSVARAALGMQALGNRSGALDVRVLELLRAADRALTNRPGEAALHSRVLSALSRALRHGSYEPPDPDELCAVADRSVQLAEGAGDPAALAAALLARHDAIWAPGTADDRLLVVARMLAAAVDAEDADLIAQAHLLRATALLELGDPAGLNALLTYITLAGDLGHARGRWGALTRQATYSAIAGQPQDALRAAEEAAELGRAIGEPDAGGVHGTTYVALAPLLGDIDLHRLLADGADPLWPLFPLLEAWPSVVAGRVDDAKAALGDFNVEVVPDKYDLEILGLAGSVFAGVGTPHQQRWAYQHLRPHSGRQIVVGGCAAYHGAVDHVLGKLAVAMGENETAADHLRAAVAQYRRLGAAGFGRLAERDLDAVVAGSAASSDVAEFRFVDGIWQFRFDGRSALLPDAKGLHDIATLLAAPHREMHVLDLLGVTERTSGSDAVLDDTAVARYRARLTELADALDRADARGDADLARRMTAEQDAVLAELRRSTALGGRPRRLGDVTERARKTVGARIRDTLNKVERVHPELGAHLRRSLHLGTTCTYTPDPPTRWRT